MDGAPLVITQIRAENRTFWRNPSAAIFTIFFPFIFLCVAAYFRGDKTVAFGGEQVSYRALVTAGVAAYGVFSACFVSLGIRMSFLRDMGVLKRVRGTPLPKSLYIAGQIGTSILVSMVLVAVLIAGARVLFSVHFPWGSLPGMIIALVFSAIVFCSLALALSGAIPNSDAAPPLVNAVAFPQLLVGGVFVTLENTHGLLWDLAKLLPLYRLAHAFQLAYVGQAGILGFSWSDIAILAAWVVISALLAVRLFRWENAKVV